MLWYSLMSERGFTIFELLVSLGLIGIFGLVGVPAIARMGGQMSAADEARHFALALVSARDEAIRLRTAIQITPTATGFTVDIDADGSIEENVSFRTDSTWDTNSSTPITFNGLGLARGISTTVTFVLKSKGVRTGVSVNRNGTVSL
jgi:type II secretory pathway pseudopilin PulG